MPGPVWVKRGDVHKTQVGDVVFAETPAEALGALEQMGQRGIGSALIQEHLPGDLIKFYVIGDKRWVPGQEPWVRFFYHAGQQVAGYPFDPRELASMTQRAGKALGLEIYGGDAIAGEGGRLHLIDLNAWPSFALFREEASERIASYLAARFTRL